MKKAILSILIVCMLMISTTVYAESNTKEQVQTDLVNVFLAIVYLDEQLEDATLIERIKIHMKVIALERELERLGAIYKELESSK